MPVINEKVRVARKVHKCDDCRKTIRPGDRYSRLFGSAEPGDPPYVIKLCTACHIPEGERTTPETDGYDYIRRHYAVPVTVGQAVEGDGKKGTVLPADLDHRHYLRVQAEGEKRPGLWHPTWETVYYNEDGSIAADYRAKQPQEATA